MIHNLTSEELNTLTSIVTNYHSVDSELDVLQKKVDSILSKRDDLRNDEEKFVDDMKRKYGEGKCSSKN